MGTFLKLILLALVLIFAFPFILALFGIGIGILVPLVTVPIGLFFALVGGLIALVAGIFGVVFSVLRWVVYLVLFVLLAGVGIWLLNRLSEKSGRSPHTRFDRDESEEMDEIQRGIGRLGRRLDSLETILEEDEKRYT
jgi:membrane protein implicated in regulation of membrane protease activity